MKYSTETDINIAEILRDCPKGIRLYSSICGGLNLSAALKDGTIFCYQPYGMPHDKRIVFVGNGHLKSFGDWTDWGECLLFPSKEMRDWSKFFKRGDIVYNEYIRGYAVFKEWIDDTYTRFRAAYFYEDNDGGHFDTNCNCDVRDYFKITDSKRIEVLLKRLEEHYNGKYNSDTLQIEPAKSKHEFKAFDKVLVRDSDDDLWQPKLFSWELKNKELRYGVISGGVEPTFFLQCIPYNDKTAHLVGTTNPYKEDE